jgi:poly(3-hydroxybutyrate) depolymerase
MKATSRLVRVAMVASVVAVAVACGGTDDDELTVTSEVVAGSRAPDLRVLAPEGEGPWPVVVALHGLDGTGQDMVELGTQLAQAGVVVYSDGRGVLWNTGRSY